MHCVFLKMIPSVIHSRMVRSETSAVTGMKGWSSLQIFRHLLWVRFVMIKSVFIHVCECLSWCGCCCVLMSISGWAAEAIGADGDSSRAAGSQSFVWKHSGSDHTHRHQHTSCVTERRSESMSHALQSDTPDSFEILMDVFIHEVCVFYHIRLMCLR